VINSPPTQYSGSPYAPYHPGYPYPPYCPQTRWDDDLRIISPPEVSYEIKREKFPQEKRPRGMNYTEEELGLLLYSIYKDETPAQAWKRYSDKFGCSRKSASVKLKYKQLRSEILSVVLKQPREIHVDDDQEEKENTPLEKPPGYSAAAGSLFEPSLVKYTVAENDKKYYVINKRSFKNFKCLTKGNCIRFVLTTLDWDNGIEILTESKDLIFDWVIPPEYDIVGGYDDDTKHIKGVEVHLRTNKKLTVDGFVEL